MMKISSRPVRLSVMPTPSTDMSRPADSAIDMLLKSRNATRIMMIIAIVPAIAVLARHAKVLPAPPNSFSPSAMHHLPTGGCTTYSALLSHRFVSPCANKVSTGKSSPRRVKNSGQLRGSPVSSIVHASLT